MQRTVVLTLGRLPVALDLARSFHAAGFRVVIAETYGMHLARMSRAVDRSVRVTSPLDDPDTYLDDILAVVNAENAQWLVPVSEETLRVAALAERLPAGVGLFAANRALLEEVHDKYRFAKLADSLGLPAPRSWLAHEFDPDGSAGTVVVKPRHSCSGRGVRFVTRGDAAAGTSADDVIQEQLHGSEISGFGIARDGTLHDPVLYRGTVLSGSVSVCFERLDGPSAALTWMHEFVRATGFTGFIAFDFIVEQDGRAVAIECNPRATSGIHFIAERTLAARVEGSTVETDTYRGHRLLTESWSCYTAILGKLGKPADFTRAFGELRRARDVSWSRRDPLPFLLMPVNTARIIVDALRARASFAEVAVRDIEWRPLEETSP